MSVPRVCAAFVLLALLVTACTAPPPPQRPRSSPSTWRLVFQNDADGNMISGSREALARALKRGSPIRVAWGEKLPDGTSVVEFAVPDFISLMNDSEVVVQFPVHVLQTSYIDAAKAELRTPSPTVWRALIATNGRFHQFHYDLETGKVVRTMTARTHVSWYAFIPDEDDRAVPELAKVGTFRLESKTP